MKRLKQNLRLQKQKYLQKFVFIHINKTAGSSIEKALKLRFEHKTALEKRAEIGPELFAEKFVFAFVRNPWDKVVSHYHYRVRTNQNGFGDLMPAKLVSRFIGLPGIRGSIRLRF